MVVGIAIKLQLLALPGHSWTPVPLQGEAHSDARPAWLAQRLDPQSTSLVQSA
jgi:hypothetical protein